MNHYVYPNSGQLDLSDTLPPTVYVDRTTFIGESSSIPFVRIGIVNRYTSIELYPPIGELTIDGIVLKLEINGHHDQDHFIMISNEHGSSYTPLHITWDECKQSIYFSFKHHSSGDFNVTDASGQEIEKYDGKYYCISETELEITALRDWSGNEWDEMYPMIIYDENGPFAQFMMEPMSTVSFRYNVVVPNHSLLKYSFDGSDSWMNEDFDDSSWVEKKETFWGTFTKDVVYFRKTFNIESIDGYNSMLIDILGYGFARIYLNGEEIDQLEMTNFEYYRLEIPYDKIRVGNNIVGISIEKTSDTNIIFDLSIRLVTLSEWIQSMTGIVREIQENPTGHPEEAFYQDTTGKWRIESYPASLEIDFSKRNVIVNRFFMEHFTDESGTITAIRIEGIKGDDVVNLYTSDKNGFMNEYDAYRLIDIANSVGYPIYRITFLSEKNNSAINVSNIRLSRIMIPSCEKMRKVPETLPNSIVLKSCGLFYAGKKQYICKVDGYYSEWVEDKSLCLSKLPPNGKAFVDFTLRLINLAYHSYNETIRDTFVRMVVDNNAFVAKDMDLLLVSDSSSNGVASIDFMIRVTVKRSGGDYIRDCLYDLKSNLTAVVHDYFSESLDGEFVGKISVYTSINLSLLIWILVGVLILVILCIVIFYLVIRYNKPYKKSLKNDVGLLDEVQ